MPTLAHPSRTRRAALAVAALAAVLATGACSSASTAGSDLVPAANVVQDPQAAVIQAASTTRSAGSAHVDARLELTVGGRSQQVDATGSVNWDAGTADLIATLPTGGSVREIVTPDALYLQLPTSPGQWRRLPLDAGTTTGTLGGALDGSRVLEDLRSVGTVTRTGSETLGGVETTRYDSRIDLSRLLDGVAGSTGAGVLGTLAGPGRVSVWIDGSGRLVQVQEAFSATVPAVGEVGMVSTVRFTEVGTPVTITPPADATTVDGPQDLVPDLGGLLGGLLGGVLGGSGGSGSGPSLGDLGSLLGGLLGGADGSGSGGSGGSGSGLGDLLGGLLGGLDGGSGLPGLGGTQGHAAA